MCPGLLDEALDDDLDDALDDPPKILLTNLLKQPMRKNLISVRMIVKPSSVSD